MKLFIKKYYSPLLLSSVIFLNSCKTAFPEPYFSDFETPPDSRQLFSDFRKKLPLKLSMDQAAVLNIGFKQIVTIGVCSFNAEKKDVLLALMTTTGMKLLEVESRAGKIKKLFSIADLAIKKNAAKQLVKDVEYIYFQPEKKADYCELSKNRLTYGWIEENKKTELIFGQATQNSNIELLMKKLFLDNNLVSIVCYSDYKMKNGRNIPMTVRYENKQFDYSLKLKTKKVFNDEK